MRVDENEVDRLLTVYRNEVRHRNGDGKYGIRAVMAEIRIPEPSREELARGAEDHTSTTVDHFFFHAGVAWLLEWQRKQPKPKPRYRVDIRITERSHCRVVDDERGGVIVAEFLNTSDSNAKDRATAYCAFLNEQEAK